MSDVAWINVAVKDSTIHVLDYNLLHKRRRSVVALHIYIYVMKSFWFKISLGILASVVLGLGFLPGPGNRSASAQEVTTPTGILITVTYSDPINIRSGPSTVLYPIVGQLAPGEIVPALGVSPGREWVQITIPAGGTGWVYAAFVSVSGGELRVVEPPPTPTPPVTATIDPTLAAAFNVVPTETRLPTFTPPPPLEVPEFDDASSPRTSSSVLGAFIIVLGLTGALGLAVSYALRR